MRGDAQGARGGGRGGAEAGIRARRTAAPYYQSEGDEEDAKFV